MAEKPRNGSRIKYSMGLWQDYQKNRQSEVLLDYLSDSMIPAMYNWLYGVAKHRLSDPYQVAIEIKNMFRVSQSVPRTRPSNYLNAEPEYRFAQFILNIAATDSRLFFTILDYLVQNYLTRDTYPEKLEEILSQAGSKYAVHETTGRKFIGERLPDMQKQLLDHVLEGENVYSSEFYDAFTELYGTNPDFTGSTREAFQALESALKTHLGEDKGENLGKILSWLRSNMSSWEYVGASDGQTDAQEQFITLVDFVNKSGRKVKHGQAETKLTVGKEHAEVNLRAVALLIFELENAIRLKKSSKDSVREK